MRVIVFIFFLSFYQISLAQLPNGFVYLHEVDSSTKLELRYCSINNFVGNQVNGYKAEVCILTTQAAQRLKAIQTELKQYNLSLKIYDAYRPQQAVNHFMRWAKDVNDTITKQQFYPNVEKKNLFKEEYIATRSRHSSGSTIDITLVDLTTGEVLDMGTPYDFFGEESWILYKGITTQQKSNRMLLQTVMKKHGFIPYPKEWWHFTLTGEPFKNQYFDFPIE